MKSFSELSLSPPVMNAINDLRFKVPSPIQAQALPILLGAPTDFIGLAATGTGKTAAFGIPLIEKIDATKRTVQALILCPTRELALQVSGQIDLMGKLKGIKSVPVYGGSSYGDQIRGFKQGSQIVVGTPGRILDHLEQGTLKLDNLQTVVLDEADEMVSMGFKEAIESILKKAPKDSCQTWLFSATMGPDVKKVAERFLTHPKKVQVNRDEVLSSTVDQVFYVTRESNKPDVLCKLIDAAEDFYGIIFCQTKNLVTDLTRYLNDRGYKVDCLHGDRSQNERERTMNAFRKRQLKILVCTDVASRGLDVKDVTHVINYSVPRELDLYVHRIGRTARSGKTGIAMSLVTPGHRALVSRIEHMTKSKMREGVLPTRKDVGRRRTSRILNSFKSEKNYSRALEVMDPQWQILTADMSRDEIIARFLALTLPDLFEIADREKITLGQARGSDQPRKKHEGKFQKKSRYRRQH